MVDIFKIAYPAVPDYNKLFKDNGEMSWNNDITSVDGGTQYNAWSVPLFNKTTSGGSFIKDTSYDGFDASNIGQHHFAFYPIGSTGKCMVMKLSEPAKIPVGELGSLTVPVLNIRLKVMLTCWLLPLLNVILRWIPEKNPMMLILTEIPYV